MATNEDLAKQVKDLQQQVQVLTDYMEARKLQQLEDPVDDISRINLGMGVVGTDTSTTPAGAVIVNTNIGQLKVLIA